MKKQLAQVAVAVLASTTLMATATPAHAQGNGDVVKRGSCERSTDWKLKVGPENGRLEVEGEVDSNRNGQTWQWRILHNGSQSANGSRVTKAPSGSFEVRRVLVNAKGTDKINFRAFNAKTGEHCSGTINF